MKRHLTKRKKAGIIDFIEIPLDWGSRHKEFIGFDKENKYFFVIFFDNKYRQDDFKYPEQRLDKLKETLAEYKKGLKDIGIFNTKKEYDETKKQIDFMEKYLK